MLEYIAAPVVARARLLKKGKGQAVRLSKDCRVRDDPDKVIVREQGCAVVLDGAWSPGLLACIGAWRGKIPRPKDEPIRSLRNPLA
jgi:hypothetical protein